MKKIIFITIFIIINLQLIYAQQKNNLNENTNSDTVTKIANSKVINGTVLDKKTRKPVPSATVRIEGSNKGTICGKDGIFRLPKGNFTKKSNIKITSIGYKSKIVTLDLTKDTVTIFLEQNSVLLSETIVIGEIDADEIIRRAIRKKDENRKKYNTMQGLLYSKFSMDFNETFNNFSLASDGNSMSFGANISTKSTEDSAKKTNDSLRKIFYQGFIGENFSQKFVDVEKNIDRTVIVNRRQTKNLPKNINRIVLEKFIDFSLDEIDFIDTKIITPLHKNSLSHYKFELIERKLFENKYIYVINVIPNTTVYPTFQGTISIIEGTYQLVEVNLKPSSDTKIYLIDSLEYYEKFENVGDDIWFPTYMESKAVLKAKLFPLIPPIDLEWTTKSIFSDVIINQPLPDSIYFEKNFNKDSNLEENSNNSEKNENIIVKNDADSAQNEYWENNSLIALTEKEAEMYNSIDTVAKKLNIDVNSDSLDITNSQQKSKFSTNFSPYIRFNRVESYVLGLLPTVEVPFAKFSGEGLYSWGQHRWFGKSKVEFGNEFDRQTLFGIKNISSNKLFFSVGCEIFSTVKTFGNPFDAVSLFSNTLDVLFFHEDYYDYFRSDGWNTVLNFNYKQLDFSATYEQRREFGLDKTTDKSFFSKKEFRQNPHPETGEFQLIKLKSAFGTQITPSAEHFQYEFNLNYQYGIRNFDNSNFSQINGIATVQLPIFETGYGNILLLLSAAGGLAEKNTPVQNLFIIEKTTLFSNLFLSKEHTFLTAYENYLGGTEFFSYHLRLNLRDWWWRLLHLPKIKGRGLELSISATTGKYFNKGNTELSNLYHSTVSDYYSELGFRIGRIPIPDTDLIFWSLEFRFGVGEYAKGGFNFLFNLNLPFLGN